MHRRRAAKGEFCHSVVRVADDAENFIQWFSGDRILIRQRISTERFLWLRVSRANLFGSVVNFSDSTGQRIDRAFPFDVHEIHLWMIEEEMVVKRGDVKTIVERS